MGHRRRLLRTIIDLCDRNMLIFGWRVASRSRIIGHRVTLLHRVWTVFDLLATTSGSLSSSAFTGLHVFHRSGLYVLQALIGKRWPPAGRVVAISLACILLLSYVGKYRVADFQLSREGWTAYQPRSSTTSFEMQLPRTPSLLQAPQELLPYTRDAGLPGIPNVSIRKLCLNTSLRWVPPIWLRLP